jgi:hypothetical protein
MNGDQGKRFAEKSARMTRESLEKGVAAAEETARSIEQGYSAAAESIRDFNLRLASITNSVAARLAGLKGGRTQAFRAARSVAVRRLLAEAEKIKTGKRPPITEKEIDQKVEDLIRSPDARTAAVGIELRHKRQAAQVLPTEEQSTEQMARGLMELCRP